MPEDKKKLKKQNQKMNITDVGRKIGRVFKNIYDEQDTRIIVEKSGVIVGALVSPFDLRRLIQLDKEAEEFFNATKRGRDAFKEVSDDEIMENAVKAVREVREEIHEEKEKLNNKE